MVWLQGRAHWLSASQYVWLAAWPVGCCRLNHSSSSQRLMWGRHHRLGLPRRRHNLRGLAPKTPCHSHLKLTPRRHNHPGLPPNYRHHLGPPPRHHVYWRSPSRQCMPNIASAPLSPLQVALPAAHPVAEHGAPPGPHNAGPGVWVCRMKASQACMCPASIFGFGVILLLERAGCHSGNASNQSLWQHMWCSGGWAEVHRASSSLHDTHVSAREAQSHRCSCHQLVTFSLPGSYMSFSAEECARQLYC